MRIAMITESPSMPSGFGQQVRMLCEEWSKHGHQMFLLTGSVPMKMVDLPNTEEWRFAELSNIDRIEQSLGVIRPQVVLVFGCTSFVSYQLRLRTAAINCPIFFWLPYEGIIVPDAMVRDFRGMPSDACVHLTKFAKKLWEPHIEASSVIPHGYDPKIWKYDSDFGPQDRARLRRKWSEKIRFPMWNDDFVVLNCDRNIWHKKWDATCDYIKKLQDRMPNRRVVLLAHTRKIQKESSNHPPGFDIPSIAKRFDIENRVAFTDFEWWQSVEREDIADMMRLCDLRLTTSAGEGFGIPTIEAAALGTLQIVNQHTTALELLGRQNPSVLPSATIEDRMGSLWSLPDVSGMVTRTMEFIADPNLATHAKEASRLWVEERFPVAKIAAKFLELFESGILRVAEEDFRISRCWGLRDSVHISTVLGDCGRIAVKLTDQAILELGARDGMFVEICAELEGNIIGIENDPKWLARLTTRARPFILEQSVDSEWPRAGVVVMTDMQDVWMKQFGSAEAVEEILKRITFYDWALLRFLPLYIWGEPTLNTESCHSVLEANGLVRRVGLEETIKAKFPNFQHEVWQNASITDVPLNLQKILGTV